MKILFSNRPTGWLILAAIVAVFMLPQLCGRGMFFDGITYSTISRNLAEGKGTFWNPCYTETLYPVFHEHPPLVFGIQSFFFRVLGDHYWTEKVYTFFTFLLSALLIIAIWHRHEKRFLWLPVLFWSSCQIVGWGYVNNMQENTMGIFCLLAAWAFIKSFRKGYESIVWQILASTSIVAALMCKGPVGMFPLAVPGLYWLATRQITFKRAFLTTAFSLIFIASIFALLIQIPAAKTNFTEFLSTQLFPALSGKREHIDGSRFFILIQLVRQLLPAIAMAGGVYLFTRRNKIEQANNGLVVFYLLVGFSASVPIMLSLKQMSAYMLPAIPFFGLAFAAWVLPYLQQLWAKENGKLFTVLNVLLLVITLGSTAYAITRINRVVRDAEVIEGLDYLKGVLPKNETVSIPEELRTEWRLQAYLMRMYHVSVDANNNEHKYLLELAQHNHQSPSGYRQVSSDKGTYLLFERKQ